MMHVTLKGSGATGVFLLGLNRSSRGGPGPRSRGDLRLNQGHTLGSGELLRQDVLVGLLQFLLDGVTAGFDQLGDIVNLLHHVLHVAHGEVFEQGGRAA